MTLQAIENYRNRAAVRQGWGLLRGVEGGNVEGDGGLLGGWKYGYVWNGEESVGMIGVC
jgi:hypothetical protein